MKKKLIPKIQFTNYRKEFPNMSENCMKQLLSVNRYWSGGIIVIGIKHYSISLDFRKDWIADFKNYPK
jgi:hypothetical protein